MSWVRLFACLVILVVAVAPEDADAVEARTALVIGNSGYSSSPLVNPRNDALDLAKVLGKLGFDVTVLTDQSQRGMKLAIRSFREKLKKRDGVGLFYYAGHGMEVGGENYLIPVGAEIESEGYIDLEGVPMREVTAGLADARNRMNIVILDACRNNPFARSFRSSSRGLAVMRAPAETLIAYATEPGSVAADGVGTRNSPYAEAFITAIQEPGVRLVDVFRRTRARVRDATGGQQIPWQSDNLTTEAFYFLPAGSGDGSALAAVRPALPSQNKGLSSGVATRGMVVVPAGEFYSGCNEKVDSECFSDEKPGKTRRLNEFQIDETEVTVAAFRECVRAGGCEEPGSADACNWGREDREDHPVNCVYWNQAAAFCEWSGKRLPTEWEWEKSARGTDGRKYPWGDEGVDCRRAVINDGSGNACGRGETTFRVGTRQQGASPYGAFDMIGNVYEWTSSKYSRSESRVVRGGSWRRNSRLARASFRSRVAPDVHSSLVGFRCAK